MVFEKKTCERCGKQYRMTTISENKGRHLCRHCIPLCEDCGGKLPQSHKLGVRCSITQAFVGNQLTWAKEREDKPWIGSGLCMDCWRAREQKKKEEEQLIRKAQLAQARETLETPSVWGCQFCRTVNRGRFCSNCGAPRKQEVRELRRLKEAQTECQ